VQHLAIFVPWEQFFSETSGDINAIWEKYKRLLSRRLAALVENIQLLRRSAEDANRDAKQWAAQSGEGDTMPDATETLAIEAEVDVEREGEECSWRQYRSDDVGKTSRLIDVLKSSVAANQTTVGPNDVQSMVMQLCEFQHAAVSSSEDFRATIVQEQAVRTIEAVGWVPTMSGNIPGQDKVKSIKTQQASASRERERMIQGIQEPTILDARRDSAAMYRVLSGFGEDNISIVPPNPNVEARRSEPSMALQLGHSTSFRALGKQVAKAMTLNRRQSTALWLICRQLDRVHGCEQDAPQLCQFVGGEGGVGKSRVIEAVVALFASRGMLHRLLVTATSGTAAANINGITIHAACNISVDSSRTTSMTNPTMKAGAVSTSLRVDGRSRMDWRDKYMLIVDEVSMLGAKTFHAINE
jgi:hypothetical protein